MIGGKGRRLLQFIWRLFCSLWFLSCWWSKPSVNCIIQSPVSKVRKIIANAFSVFKLRLTFPAGHQGLSVCSSMLFSTLVWLANLQIFVLRWDPSEIYVLSCIGWTSLLFLGTLKAHKSEAEEVHKLFCLVELYVMSHSIKGSSRG